MPTRSILRNPASRTLPLLALAALACEAPPLRRVERSLDLMAALPRAHIVVPGRPAGKPPEDYVHVQNVTARHLTQTAIFVHPPASVEFTLPIHPGARLETAVALASIVLPESDGMTFVVEVRQGGKTDRLWSLTVGRGRPAAGGWHPLSLDLSAYAGRDVGLVLRTEPLGNGTKDWGGFASPQVVSDGTWQRGAPFLDRSVVMVSLDTLRVDRLGSFGHPDGRTPHLDALLRRCRLYPDAHSPSHWTLPAHMSAMTSAYPDVHRVGPDRALGPGLPAVAEVLAEVGYRNVGLVADITWLDVRFGFARGFHTYHVAMEPTRHRTRRLQELLERRRGRRVLAWLHAFDAHSDERRFAYESSPAGAYLAGLDLASCQACQGYASEALVALNAKGERLAPEQEVLLSRMYDAGLFDLDHEVALLRRTLEEMELLQRSLLVLFSDHGEELGDHGKYLHDQTYPELTSSLLALGLPGETRGRLAPGMPTLVDIGPTVAEFARVPAPRIWQGRSLWHGAPTEAYTVSQFGGVTWRDGSRTLQLSGDHAFLYDRLSDPMELRPRPAALGSPELAALRARRAAHAALADSLTPGIEASRTQEELERLKALGYNQ